MNYDINWVIDKFDRGERLKYVFFWGHHPSATGETTKSCFSQWYECEFTVDGVKYHTAEQYMMAQKALLFGDSAVYDEIMAASHPKQFKTLGRKITPFDEATWNSHKKDIVVCGNLAKFSQNTAMGEFLLGTGNRILVEASPYDKIWGIGRAASDDNIENPHTWRGENNLGFALMEVRDMLAETADV